MILTSYNEVPEESCLASPAFAAQLRKPYRLEELLDHLKACRTDDKLNPA